MFPVERKHEQVFAYRKKVSYQPNVINTLPSVIMTTAKKKKKDYRDMFTVAGRG